MRPSKSPLISGDAIERRVGELAEELSPRLQARDVVAIPVLKGGVHFASDLIRKLTFPVRIDFIRARSYEGTASSGEVEFLVLPSDPLAGAHVLLIDDILDTGRTMAAIMNWLESQSPAAITLCTLLDKPGRREVAIDADFVGFSIDNHFVVGYGLDYEERYRELPGIYVLED